MSDQVRSDTRLSSVSRDVRDQIADLQADYIAALDSQDMKGWLASFDENNSSYFCRSKENEDDGLEVGYMFDDCHERICDRVKFVDEIWAGTFEEYQTRHFLQPTRCKSLGEDLYSAQTNFTVMYTDDAGITKVLASGCYDDEIVVNGVARLRSRKAVLDTNVVPRYMVYPI
jgi:3-phenylpropionate/cinnamic acid dioxygenase small subunit